MSYPRTRAGRWIAREQAAKDFVRTLGVERVNAYAIQFPARAGWLRTNYTDPLAERVLDLIRRAQPISAEQAKAIDQRCLADFF